MCQVPAWLVLRGGPIELERMDSTDAPLAGRSLHGVGDRHLRQHGSGEGTALLGVPPAAAPARLADAHRPLHVRPAICRKVAHGPGTIDEGSAATMTPSEEIDARIAALGDWRGQTLARIRKLIHEADPDVVEEVKWRKPSSSMSGVPVWEHAGIVCTGETYKDKVKLTFAKGASLSDAS